MKKHAKVSRSHLYFLLITIIASGLTYLFVDMTSRVYSFTSTQGEFLEASGL